MILIFDIGKTNKKALVFDDDYQVIEEKQTTFDEVADIDGDPTDDVSKIESWMLQTLKDFEKLDITHINFATYGATVAHLDKKGKLLANPFNYLKKIDPTIKQAFLKENGGATEFCTTSASPDLDFLLNSGFQLYWLKKAKPDFFNKIHTTLHLPQYFSYALIGKKSSEYTSIGCHTMLWDFNKNDYHDWVKKEGLTRFFPKILPISTVFNPQLATRNPQLATRNPHLGIGIHDSSAALLPYLVKEKNPFLLLSTGTWSICLNPFNKTPLTADEFAQDCLFYMRPDGENVKAARLFLGKIHDEAVEKIAARFHQKPEAIRSIKYDNFLQQEVSVGHLKEGNEQNLTQAYHVLMVNLVEKQKEKIELAAEIPIASPDSYRDFEKIFIDGGFAKNDLFLNMLKNALPKVKIEPSDMPQGTALGAALALDLPQGTALGAALALDLKKSSLQN